MPEPANILFLLEDLCYGGTQRQMLELLLRLDRERFAPSVLTLTGPTDLDSMVREANIPLHHLGTSRRVDPLFVVHLRSFLRRNKPDLLVPCTALPNIWGRIWGWALGIPVVGTCRGGGGPRRQHERWLWRLAAHMVCNSQPLREVLHRDCGVPLDKLSCIPNGVNTSFFSPQEPLVEQRPPVILCVARLAKDKDHVTLFEAFAQVLEQEPAARLHLVGDGPEEANLKKWAESHACGQHIHFFPGTTDVRQYYAGARIFALASVREGQPNVLLEAMSSGLPVCATSVGGIPLMVHHGETGLLSQAKDAGGFAKNCLQLLGNPLQCADFGRRGREIVESQYTYESMVREHERIFAQYCQHRGRG